MKKILTTLTLLSCASVFAQEGMLRIPFNFENAAVLPPKIRNVRYMNAHVDAQDRYNGFGNTTPLGDKLNKKITWNDSIKGKKSAYEKALLKGTLKAYNVNTNEYIGQTTGEVNISVDAQVPVIAYGVTKKFTLAMAIPVVSSNINIDTGFIANQNLNNFTNKVVKGKLNSNHNAYKVQNDTLIAISKKLEDNGYLPLEASLGRRQEVGDIKLVGKYQYQKTEKMMNALRMEITAPTGRPLDVNKAVDFASGDDQWDIGLGNATQYNITKDLSFMGFIGYTVQLEKTAAKRIREEYDSAISEDIDNDTTVDLGDFYKMQAALSYNFLNGFNLIGGAVYQKKYSDSYDGKKYAKYRYDWMSQDSDQSMLTAQAGFGFSTIPLFRQKKFAVPLQTNLFYTSVVDGRNVIKDDVYTFEFAMFF